MTIEQIFQKASRIKLRVQTSKGNLSVEDLWDLSISELDKIAVRLEEESKETTKSFIRTSRKSSVKQLRFDIVLHILRTKVTEDEEARKKASKAQSNQRIMELIRQKQDQQLADLSVEELEKMLED